jgi:hypothetical protein
MRCSLPSAASPLRVPSGRVTSPQSTVRQGRAGGERSGWGALSLALTPCYTCEPAREARMERRLHEGILYQGVKVASVSYTAK